MIKPAAIPALPRSYPHVDDITDWRAQQTIRLLWDRVWSLEAQLQAVVTTQGDLVSATNRQDDAIRRANARAGEALAITQRLPDEPIVPGAGSGGGGVTPKPLVWAWIDRGGYPVVAPDGSVGAPTTLDEWRVYFFGLMGKTIGEPADDYEVWLNGLIDNGMMVNALPGVVPDATWPFYGIHLLVDAGGHPRGRIQLPTAISTNGETTGGGSGYFTHEFDVIADA